MSLWEIEFCPKEGENNSPVDALQSLCNENDIAHFMAKLNMLKELKAYDWNFNWLKSVRGLNQIAQGDFRMYFQPMKQTIVVCHVCRKVTQKAKDEDIGRAYRNLDLYPKDR